MTDTSQGGRAEKTVLCGGGHPLPGQVATYLHVKVCAAGMKAALSSPEGSRNASGGEGGGGLCKLQVAVHTRGTMRRALGHGVGQDSETENPQRSGELHKAVDSGVRLPGLRPLCPLPLLSVTSGQPSSRKALVSLLLTGCYRK